MPLSSKDRELIEILKLLEGIKKKLQKLLIEGKENQDGKREETA